MLGFPFIKKQKGDFDASQVAGQPRCHRARSHTLKNALAEDEGKVAATTQSLGPAVKSWMVGIVDEAVETSSQIELAPLASPDRRLAGVLLLRLS